LSYEIFVTVSKLFLLLWCQFVGENDRA
jgi:hypothetical protein